MLQNFGEEASWKVAVWKSKKINMDVTGTGCEDRRSLNYFRIVSNAWFWF
jgi:hypothetical protein